eukprot:TRINITY_DN1348_c0_g1_i3.p1 TRINITY_DN1348_c0_g1~~TRINITY_DN1348_c0_g1_i3.p1  ORF type:complete len:142 (+),score=29.53 TRINITY_DN1348_c0_g1_i3:37-462(+)
MNPVQSLSLFLFLVFGLVRSESLVEGGSSLPRVQQHPKNIFNISAELNQIEGQITRVEEEILQMEQNKVKDLQRVSQEIERIRKGFTEELTLNGMSSGVLIIVISTIISFLILGLGYHGFLRSRKKAHSSYSEGLGVTEHL